MKTTLSVLLLLVSVGIFNLKAQVSVSPSERQVGWASEEAEDLSFSAEGLPFPSEEAECPPWSTDGEAEYSWTQDGDLQFAGPTNGPSASVVSNIASSGTLALALTQGYVDAGGNKTKAKYNFQVKVNNVFVILESFNHRDEPRDGYILFDGPTADGQNELKLLIQGIPADQLKVEPQLFTTAAGNKANELNTLTHNFVKVDGNAKWKVDRAIWYGVTPSLPPADPNRCYFWVSEWELWVDISFDEKHLGRIESPMRISLERVPRDVDEAKLNWGESVAMERHGDVYSAPGGKFRVKYRYNIVKKADKFIRSNNQYKAKITAEEEYHVKQIEGQVALNLGGNADLWTNRGFQHIMKDSGNALNKSEAVTEYEYEADSEAEVLELAQADMVFVLNEELHLSDIYFQDRKCLREKKAKVVAGFEMAYDLKCAYPECPENIDEAPILHPAYVND